MAFNDQIDDVLYKIIFILLSFETEWTQMR